MTATSDPTTDPTGSDLRWFLSQARPRRLRSMRRFAEDEIVLPAGPFAGRRFRCSRQPFTGLWFDAVDEGGGSGSGGGGWSRCVATGPSQSGKTLACFVIPILYHLFEVGETVICGLPDMDMAADKWRQDLLPVIERCRYRTLLPTRGGGSRGGRVESVRFANGATLKFMSGGGGDKSRAGFAARVVAVTETDGLDTAGGRSRETDKIGQLAARTHAFGDRARLYMECTVSTEQGRTWREITGGTRSRIALPCPHCGAYVTPEREHLTGWSDAKDVVEAGEGAALACPACGVLWSEAERAEANRCAKLVHRGQSIDEQGNVTGPVPPTRTLGFRFTAANNLLMTMGRVAEEEWEAPRTTDAELAERKLRQFFWALPSEAEATTLSQVDAAAIAQRAVNLPRGRVPRRVVDPHHPEHPDSACPVTLGIDVGKWLCHWVAVAWRQGAAPHVLEYGRLEVPSSTMAEELAILAALRQFRDEVVRVGWPLLPKGQEEGTEQMDQLGGGGVLPQLVLIDSGHWEATVVGFCGESGRGFLPSKGFGVQQLGKRRILAEPGYEAVRQPAGHTLVEINADWWKSFVHSRLQTPTGQPGGLTLYHAPASEHLSFAKHLTAERRVEEFVAGKGLVGRWEAVHRNNHWLDALALACVGGHGIGQRVVGPNAPTAPSPSPPRPDPPSISVDNWLRASRERW